MNFIIISFYWEYILEYTFRVVGQKQGWIEEPETNITGNVHKEYRSEDPGCGVAPTVLHCAVAVFPA